MCLERQMQASLLASPVRHSGVMCRALTSMLNAAQHASLHGAAQLICTLQSHVEAVVPGCKIFSAVTRPLALRPTEVKAPQSLSIKL
uniref:Uncharacterized protein n=2 Tax=Anguilla anguilla TaxID=7936 RepID=A0A0E9QUI7_ANGAN